MQRLQCSISWHQTTEVSFTSVLETEVKLTSVLETKGCKRRLSAFNDILETIALFLYVFPVFLHSSIREIISITEKTCEP